MCFLLFCSCVSCVRHERLAYGEWHQSKTFSQKPHPNQIHLCIKNRWTLKALVSVFARRTKKKQNKKLYNDERCQEKKKWNKIVRTLASCSHVSAFWIVPWQRYDASTRLIKPHTQTSSCPFEHERHDAIDKPCIECYAGVLDSFKLYKNAEPKNNSTVERAANMSTQIKRRTFPLFFLA